MHQEASKLWETIHPFAHKQHDHDHEHILSQHQYIENNHTTNPDSAHTLPVLAVVHQIVAAEEHSHTAAVADPRIHHTPLDAAVAEAQSSAADLVHILLEPDPGRILPAADPANTVLEDLVGIHNSLGRLAAHIRFPAGVRIVLQAAGAN